ncbi:MAG: hypothetical protein H5U02_00445 [Clostridia bacterium]|nr:hypothetical protein [Clostridia bacterium]
MPIKGISDVRRLPRLGKIRLGIKQTSKRTGNEYPKAVDFFVCRADGGPTSEEMAKAFHAVYGDQPRALDVMFPTNDPEQIFPQYYRRYGSGTGLICKGDGESAMEIDRETGEMREIECVPAECEWAKKQHCRPVGTLRFLLPKVPGIGVWQIDTSSYHSIVNLNSAIEMVRLLTGGRIAMIPLRLVIRPKEVQVEGKKKVVFVMDLATENLRMVDVLAASQKKLPELLLPEINMDEPPDDLFPHAVPVEPEGEAEAEGLAAEEGEEEGPGLREEAVRLMVLLGMPPAKRKAVIEKPGQDFEKLVARLKAELEKKKAEKVEEAGAEEEIGQEDGGAEKGRRQAGAEAPAVEVPVIQRALF